MRINDMAQQKTGIKTKGILYTPFGSFSGSTEYVPSLSIITFLTTASSRLNNSLLAYVTKSRLNKLKQYFDSPMACKTEISGTGIVTFYMFEVDKVVMAQTDLQLPYLHVIGLVKSKCVCFMN
jgi:hypothetical protein